MLLGSWCGGGVRLMADAQIIPTGSLSGSGNERHGERHDSEP
jgi:hypothetical protein